MSGNWDIAVIDLFAGPGGLGEGFSAFKSRGSGHPFRVTMSVEMDKHAHRTLRLRSFYRQYATAGMRVPEAYYKVLRGAASESDLARGRWSDKWEAAEHEAIHAELGTPDADAIIDERLRSDRLVSEKTPVVLLGGPPCQAYSLVGRARNRGIVGYRAEDDGRHVLYRQYLRILSRTWPVAFVMENVKGILSSQLDGSQIFPRILDDLHDPLRSESRSLKSSSATRYNLYTITVSQAGSSQFLYRNVAPSSFVVRCEDHGIPQRRHRVFVIGIREDLQCPFPALLPRSERRSLWSVIGDMPPVYPRISNRLAGFHDAGLTAIDAARSALTKHVLQEIASHCGSDVAAGCKRYLKRADSTIHGNVDEYVPDGCLAVPATDKLLSWLHDPRLGGVCNHVAKSHMPSDLGRYLFASVFAETAGRSPKLEDFPPALLPKHANVSSAAKRAMIFTDRFRVQLRDEPSTTITSHLAKDGHYYIHPDPQQMRSLTVREAARLQTFPDNYFFCGPRTAQYQQVGNAVPPFLARQIAHSLHGALSEVGI